MLKFLLSVRAVLIALVVYVPCAVHANDSCANDANDAISPYFALCSTHAYNIGRTDNPGADERALMKEVIGMKTTLITQQMYKQYEQMESMLRRFKTQLEKAVTMSKFEMAGADSEKSSSSSGHFSSNDSRVNIAGTQNCSRLYKDEEILKCYQTNLDIVEHTSNYGNDVTSDLKAQLAGDFKALKEMKFGAERKSGCVEKTEDDYKNCFNKSTIKTSKAFKSCMEHYRDCLQAQYRAYNDQERSYNTKGWNSR